MSKDELQFISDLTEKHEISFHNLLCLIGSGVTSRAMMLLETGDTDGEREMVDLEADISRALGIVSVAELLEELEGSDDFE